MMEGGSIFGFEKMNKEDMIDLLLAGLNAKELVDIIPVDKKGVLFEKKGVRKNERGIFQSL